MQRSPRSNMEFESLLSPRSRRELELE